MKRRSFLAGIGAAVAAWFAPKIAVDALPEVVEAAAPIANPAAGAFLAAKIAETDALYASMAQGLSLYMWGDVGKPIAELGKNQDAT